MKLPPWTSVVAAMAAGALALAGLSELLDALSGPGMPLIWWSIRALGLVALLSLWLGMLFGVLVSGKGGLVEAPVALGLHQHHVLAASVATALHVLLVVADTTTDIPAVAVLIPWTSPTWTGPVALGAVALWALIAVVATTALRSRLSASAWRAVHATAFGGFVVALAHGWMAGTDSGSPGVRMLYLATGATLVGAVVQRLLLASARSDTTSRPIGGTPRTRPAPGPGARG